MKVWQQLEGILEQVDLLNRTARIRKDQRALTFDLPPACDILLRGERVKLRMLQPSDRVTVRYRSAAGRHVASLIEVLAATQRSGRSFEEAVGIGCFPVPRMEPERTQRVSG